MHHGGDVWGAIFFSDESRILSWSNDETLRLWDVAKGTQIGPAMRHEGDVWGAILSNDESRILSWSSDKTLRLWDVATGKQIGPAMQHDGVVSGAMLSKDESRILSWSEDNTLRLWDNRWAMGNILKLACTILPDHDLSEVSQRYAITATDPICVPTTALAKPDWTSIVRQSTK
jgi:WD40 repeat protein